jgi:acyl-CoA synthetase (AMP-forming)/AMP-acid ligase II
MARQGHGFLVVDEVRVVKRPSEEESVGSKIASLAKKVTVGNDDEDRELVDVARDGKEIGEIIMRGNLAMLEYYQDKEATAKTIKNGWLHTGDLAVRYPGGEVFVADRAKDIIISGGENISSLMVESEMADHADVLESCVVARDHEKWGEVGHAFVVLKPGKQKDVEKLREHCKTRMSKFAVPLYIDIVDELPKTSTGKIQKK